MAWEIIFYAGRTIYSVFRAWSASIFNPVPTAVTTVYFEKKRQQQPPERMQKGAADHVRNQQDVGSSESPSNANERVD